jgi:hypothetical protein
MKMSCHGKMFLYNIHFFIKAILCQKTVLLLYLFSLIFLFLKSIYFSQPYIMGDELAYKSMAYSFFEYRTFYHYTSEQIGYTTNIPNILYQLLISPAFFYGDNFFIVIKFINSMLVSTAIYPIYYLTLRIANKKYAITAAILFILMPENNFAINVMPENLYLPLFVLTFVSLYNYIIKPNIYVLIFSAMLLSLLYLTKPHAISLLVSFLLLYFIYTLKSLNDKDFKGVKIFIKTIFVLFIAFIACYVLFKSLIHGEFIYKFWEMGTYSNIVAAQSNFQPSELFNVAFFKMVLAHLSSISIVYFLPISSIAHSITVSYRTGENELFSFNLFLMIVLIVTLSMVFKFTYDIASVENYSRLHARYYYMIYPLLLVAFMLNYRNLKRSRLISVFFLLIIFFTQTYILFSEYAYNYGYVADNPGLAWLFLIRNNSSLFILITLVNIMLIVGSYFFKINKIMFLYVLFAITMFIFSGWAHLYMASSLHHKNALYYYNTTAMIQRVVGFDKNIAIIDSSYQHRMNMVFWMFKKPTRVFELPIDSIIISETIPSDTDIIIMFDRYDVNNLNYRQSDELITSLGNVVRLLYLD